MTSLLHSPQEELSRNRKPNQEIRSRITWRYLDETGPLHGGVRYFIFVVVHLHSAQARVHQVELGGAMLSGSFDTSRDSFGKLTFLSRSKLVGISRMSRGRS